MDFFALLEISQQEGIINAELFKELENFYQSYLKAAGENGKSESEASAIMTLYLTHVLDQLQNPIFFDSFHEKIQKPIDFYKLGLDFVKLIVIKELSSIENESILEKIEQQIEKGENVILFANHQTEVDPQAIFLMLEEKYAKLAESMIMVAGQRVLTDPLAVPMSKGCNLLCVYSRRYIEDHPESKAERLAYNQSSMKKMGQLLSEGGKCIYVAPSGGRDRPNKKGVVEVAHFDPQSIEMFWLMSQHADQPTHFYPLALSTHALLPPPHKIKKTLGEPRNPQATPIHLAFGEEIDMENIPEIRGSAKRLDKKQKRKVRAEYIWKRVSEAYAKIAK